jgi:peptidoglycan/LPS O-acetylase OafA/YrhL
MTNKTSQLDKSDSIVQKYYPFLDSFRGIAILWVIFHHAVYFFSGNGLGFLPLKMAKLGFLGVDLFFVTSGFLITGLLMEEFFQGQLRVQRFYIRRFFKIVPHYFLTIIVALGFASFLTPGSSIESIQIFNYSPIQKFCNVFW